MKKGLNFRTIESQKEYFEAYEKALKLIAMPVAEKYVTTSFGDSHVVCCGDENNPPWSCLTHPAAVRPFGIRIYHFGAIISASTESI